MGIPRFYRWLKTRFPLIRFDLSDKNKQIPTFDHFYIDFNALVYQCIRESNCFLRNKIKPLTFDQIYERVFFYLQQLIEVVNPQDMIFIAFDGVAPRAKINQSRDRRFKSSSQQQLFEKVLEQIGVQDQEYFQQNSISPGTKFLYDLCSNLKDRIMKEMEHNWKNLKIFFSDCCVPGEGQHKIMDFLRYTKKYNIFSKNTTMCVYSPDADVILLTLSLGIDNICLIKEDTSGPMGPNWTATTVYRKSQTKLFELVMINVLREYFEKEFAQVLKQVPGSTIQAIIDDLILLMAFVGNDFLPLEFCFTLKDNHIENLFVSYKTYLREHKEFINNRGKIDWQNVYKLLEIGKRFEAKMIEEMIMQRKGKRPKNMVEMTTNNKNKNASNGSGQTISEVDQLPQDIENFEVENENITKGRDKYYQTRFGIKDIKTDPKYEEIIKSYIEGLEFYCEYYFIGLPSWSWYYPYHYTPMLTDVYEYLRNHKVNVNFPPSQPFDPFLALMFMVSLRSTILLPKPIEHVIKDQTSPLRSPVDYFPTEFQLDKFQSLRYNKRAIIDFLNQETVRKVYLSITTYSQEQRKRNQRRDFVLFVCEIISQKIPPIQKIHEKQFKLNRSAFMSETEIQEQEIVKEQLKKIFAVNNKQKELITKQRFPTLKIWGNNFEMKDGKIITKNKYKYSGNPGEIVFFNNFLGIIEDADNSNQQLKTFIEMEYEKNGIIGKCDFVYTIKRVNFTRQINRFCLTPSRKQVLVPDFAVYKPPNYDYIRKTEAVESQKLFQKGELVSILTAKYFGYHGIIEKVDQKTVQVMLTKPAVQCQQKIQQLEDEFYTVDYVLDHLNIKYETLIAIMDEVVILPQFNRKKQPVLQAMPTAVNFSLNIIDINQRLIVPRFVRCQMQHENTRRPQQIFKKMQISKAALQNLEKYVETFDWLIQYIEDAIQDRSFVFRRPIYARQIFSDFQRPNIHMYREFIKLYEFDNEGCFYSIYSKVSNKIPEFSLLPFESQKITLKHNEVISKRQARVAPPALKYEPEYHNIGDKVILLRNLETGYIFGIDDNMIHIKVGKQQRHFKVRFHDVFNENWSGFLAVQEGKTWNLESSYFTPTYWKKAIDLQKNEDEVESSDFD